MTRQIYHHCPICHEDKPVAMEPDHGALFYLDDDDGICCDEPMLPHGEAWRDERGF